MTQNQMRSPQCNQCHRTIPSEEINVSKDLAYCRTCNLAFALSQMAHGAGIDGSINPQHPTKGCWYRSQGDEIILGGTHLAIGSAVLVLVFTVFWNSIVSLFVTLATVSTLSHMGISVPGWFPFKISNQDQMGAGMTAFLWLFLTPFIGIGLMMIGHFFSTLFGRTELRIRASEGTLFVGIGSIGYKKPLNPRAVKDVRIDYSRPADRRNSDAEQKIIVEFQDGKVISFGSMLPWNRRQFVAAALSRALKL